jgi:type I restriction enzyme S subunit
MMQELLTGKTRLPGFSDPWHQSTLGELGRCIRGVGYNPDEDLSTGDRTCTIRLLRGNNVQAARVDLGDLQFVHERRVSDVQLLTPSDIVICMSSGSRALVGKSALFDITDTGHRYTFGAFMGAFRPNPRRVSPGFVAGVLHTYSFRTWLEIILSGSSINNLRPRDIEGFVCHFPKEDEQRAIAAVLADADAEIELLQGRLTKARDIKQGMAQELLTGRTRLPVEEGAT